MPNCQLQRFVIGQENAVIIYDREQKREDHYGQITIRKTKPRKTSETIVDAHEASCGEKQALCLYGRSKKKEVLIIDFSSAS